MIILISLAVIALASAFVFFRSYKSGGEFAMCLSGVLGLFSAAFFLVALILASISFVEEDELLEYETVRYMTRTLEPSSPQFHVFVERAFKINAKIAYRKRWNDTLLDIWIPDGLVGLERIRLPYEVMEPEGR